ncbi:MAG: transcription termination/antitermination protein NusA [Ruminococcaceae bacterium]|jgi:N utilization substance protein A|nr:transcription termination/antitermination protein NusA [Oscillospiraceae bacterium]
MSKQNKEFFEAVNMMEKERGIPAEFLFDRIKTAIVTQVKKLNECEEENVGCEINPDKYLMRIYLKKEVVETVERPTIELTVEQAQEIKKNAKVGDIIEVDLDPKEFGRITAQSTKHAIRSGLRDAEKGIMLKEFQSKQQEIVNAKVVRVDPVTGNATVEIGKSEAILPKNEQVEGEILHEGDTVKVYIIEARVTDKGPKAMISRRHPNLIRRLFEEEVPEIFDGTVTIEAVSREAGARTKMAVFSKDEDIDPVGACIGSRGQRVEKIVELLGGEKIDIVKYSEDPTEFVAAALAPANVLKVEIVNEQEKSCQVTVPDNQLSLAIGNKGQNARLAARLTGWKIDIKPESGFYEG